ncbi:MAG: MiaB/RimO family radical SAM methylthiotransferase [Leptospirales bacterium]|nr:MiaB/RimO family radical SAM methylthiotransferase [Leptospirales bacterium]
MAASYYITTLGCPKNQADSREMDVSLARQGFERATSADRADLHLINSCAFIESARVETIQMVMEAAQLKRSHGAQHLVLAGCFAERYSSEVQNELPEVDLSFGTGIYHRAGEIVAERFGLSGAHSIDQASSLANFLPTRFGRPYAPVKLSDGCDRGCSFCAIPQFRGPFRQREETEILAECAALVERGVRELMLVSQDTNRYGGRDVQALPRLVEDISQLPGVQWLRLLYLYPDARTEQLLRELARRRPAALVPYLETPLQHVSARVLRAMRRSGDRNHFADLFALARDLFADLEIRTSFLVGFPGEEEEDVQQLLEFIKEMRPEKMAVFTYSPEEGSPGFDLGDPVSEEQKAERANRLRQAHLAVLRELHAQRVGRSYRCMVEKSSGQELAVRRPQDAPEADELVFLDPEPGLRPGDMVDVEISGFFEYDMSGRLLARSAR